MPPFLFFSSLLKFAFERLGFHHEILFLDWIKFALSFEGRSGSTGAMVVRGRRPAGALPALGSPWRPLHIGSLTRLPLA